MWYCLYMLVQHRFPGCELDPARSVRAAVFQVEQGIPATDDFDDLDQIAHQFVAFDRGQPVGTARYRILDSGIAKVERVAVLSSHRGKKVGRMLMHTVEHTAWRQHITGLTLEAQLTAADFYARQGYEKEGDIFEEVGIPHIKMSLDVRHPSETAEHYGLEVPKDIYDYVDIIPTEFVPRTSVAGPHPMFSDRGTVQF